MAIPKRNNKKQSEELLDLIKEANKSAHKMQTGKIKC